MKAIFFEEPVDHYACVERAWRRRLDESDEQAIFLRSRPGQWSGKPGSWSIKYVLEGHAAFEIDGQWCEIHQGFSFVVPENTPYRSILHHGRTISLFGRALAGVGPESRLALRGVFELTVDEKQALNHCLEWLESRGRAASPIVPDLGTDIHLERAFPVPRSWRQARLAVDGWLESSPNALSSAQRLIRARHFLTARFRDKSVCRLAAEQASMTRHHFSRAFSRLLGKSPRKYLVDYRTSVARELLASGRYSVEQVAGALGYRHASSLNHLFKRNGVARPGSLRGAFRPGDSS